MAKYIGIDLGGTNVKGIVINENGEILRHHSLPTQDTGDGAWRAKVLTIMQALRDAEGGQIDGIGMSAPGLPDADNRSIAYLPNRLAGLERFDWSAYFGQPAHVLNDAHAALIAESAFGAAKGLKNVVLLTLGTGVGGGLLLNGELYQGLSQMAGHLGHVCLNSGEDEPSILGMPGSLEYAFGNYSVGKRTRGRYASAAALAEAYKNGDPVGSYHWLNAVRHLALGIASFINALSPDTVALSGGITQADDELFVPLAAFLDEYEFRPGGKKTPVVKAHFSETAGALGAAAFAMRRG